MTYVETKGLKVAQTLYNLVRDEIVPGLEIEADELWQGLATVVDKFAARNKALLEKRDQLQAQIDQWLEANPGASTDQTRDFLLKIGYLVPEGDNFTITTAGVDDEIALIAGPQLVVPIDNARYALNAANARWGSLYDALYGTDLIPEAKGEEQGQSYNPKRGEKVIAKANDFLDQTLPLNSGNWHQLAKLSIAQHQPVFELNTGEKTQLANTDHFVGYQLNEGDQANILFKHHNLHIDVLIDPAHPIGRQHPAKIKDVHLESAISTILDCEDSVAAVDAEDKAVLYRHWTQMMRGNLTATFAKGARTQTRKFNPNREYLDGKGQSLSLHGRSLLLVRHVGAHLYTHAVTDLQGEAIPETFLDAALTIAGGIPDIKGNNLFPNSRTGSLYVVKPKHHGPEEVQLSVEVFECLEQAFGLSENTVKIGIMDEERRTSLNLKECIRKAKDRVIFINTGFLDRTGDEIHTHMAAGAVLPKLEIKAQPWIGSYEKNNVSTGLACGFQGTAQIGKGMWPEPDAMAAMMDSKISHPRAGANCAWVPSPVAATLHAMHYHQVLVSDCQNEIKQQGPIDTAPLLQPPLLGSRKLSAEEIQQELDNNTQGILGYVARWVEQGIGCSKVPDVNDIGLMEDRATLRISSQHIANWLKHGITNQQQVLETMQRMARKVDQQNSGDSNYRAMAPDYEKSLAFEAAAELIFSGHTEPNGYTEHILIRLRQAFKQTN